MSALLEAIVRIVQYFLVTLLRGICFFKIIFMWDFPFSTVYNSLDKWGRLVKEWAGENRRANFMNYLTMNGTYFQGNIVLTCNRQSTVL